MDSDDYQPPKKRMKFGGKKKTPKNAVIVDSKKKRPSVNFLSMNDECMLKLFQYLSISELFRLCEISTRLKVLISEKILNERLIDFDELPNIGYEKVFSMFGKYMVKMKIGEKHVQNVELNHSKFDEILHQIQKHCSKDGSLKHVEFEFCNSTTIINEAVLKDALPFFRNVESFEMNQPMITKNLQLNWEYVLNDSVNNFIDAVVMNAIRIKSIKFQNFRVKGGWLALDHLRNVENLSFINCNLEKNPCLIAFMQKKPALSSFTWRNSCVDRVNDSANFVLDLVGNNLPQLKILNFTRNFGCFQKNIYVPETNNKAIKPSILNKLINLKELTISWNHNNTSAVGRLSIDKYLIYLVVHNSVEKLSISLNMINWNQEVLKYLNLQRFTSLKCVKISGIVQYNFYCILKFLSKIPNLRELCLISCEDICRELSTFLRSVKKISILKVEAPISKFSMTDYSNILRIRTENLIDEPSDEPLRVYIDKSPLDALIQKLKKKYKPNIVRLVPLE